MGCAVGGDAAREDEGATFAAEGAIGVATESCTDQRWVAVKPPDRTGGTSCPSLPPAPSGATGHYGGTPLFQQPSVEGPATDPRSATVLQGYCYYRWIPDDPGSPKPTPVDVKWAITQFNRTFRGDAHRDCHVVAPLASSGIAEDPKVWSELERSYRKMTDRLEKLPDLGLTQPARVEIAVVDSAPNRWTNGPAGVRGTYAHGHLVGRVIRDLACPADVDGPNCIGDVTNHLALSLVSPLREDLVNGGFFGTQAQLARAIEDAVDQWAQRAAHGGTQPRLVINLSVGWDSKTAYGGVLTGTKIDPRVLDPQVRAVHTALRHAACRGAIVVAAAGNGSGGRAASPRPMIPAQWETLSAPDYRECTKIEGSASGWKPFDPNYPVFDAREVRREHTGSSDLDRRRERDDDDDHDLDDGREHHRRRHHHPLVYAVGALDAHDHPLVNSRPNARARLAAYGFEVADPDAGDTAVAHVDVMSGTSMSTAVVSGIAAAVWGYRPKMTAYQVMDHIYDTAVKLEPKANFCEGHLSSCPSRVRRVSLCRAVHFATKPGTPSRCETVGAHGGASPFTSTGWGGFTPAPTPMGQVRPCSGCTLPSAVYETKATRPWVDPQPGKGGCEVCRLGFTGDFDVSLDPEFYGAIVTGKMTADLYLSVMTRSGVRAEYYLQNVTSQVFTYGGVGADGGGLADDPLPIASFKMTDIASGGVSSTQETVLY